MKPRIRAAVRRSGGPAARAAVFLIQLYRNTVSPLRLPSCRFSPTCSEYAVDALTEHGLIRGTWLAAVRLAKCGPWHLGGWDPVPERRGDAADRHADGDVWGAPAQQGESESYV
jgi:uncharacterized protein